MITPEELELLDESTRNKILNEIQEAQKIKSELTSLLSKAYANPEAKAKLEEALKAIDSNINLPPNPAESYIIPLKKELEELKQKQAFDELSRRLREKAARLGISPEEAPEIEKFATENGIINYEKALELYAQHKKYNSQIDYSATNGDLLADVMKSKNDFTLDLNQAKQNAIKKLSMIG
ncbi:MAG: hypothetical protein C0173_09780 [Desulfurella sp.]|uniref:hypothetical protein n=1 Tax=Desulfurella sp. TaxID=1962857 RepID=UPI000CC8FC20|nr:hypothetical protein [Desulfurella sp.]PMP87198.1 MAG: hypothetical protein C0173_09780 [Desulfurella sp.]